MLEISSGTVVTGASDDLIEISGELEEEFNTYDCLDGTMAFSDGTLLRVDYDEMVYGDLNPYTKGTYLGKWLLARFQMIQTTKFTLKTV